MFKFNEKTHTYTLDGKRMTGVTTVLGVINKPALVGWAANQAVEYIKTSKVWQLVPDTPRKIMIGDKELEKLLNEARKAHIRKRDKAGQSGTDVHGDIETHIKFAIENSDGIIVTGGNYEKKQVEHFLNWAEKNKIKFLASEKRVYSKTHFTAGTYDFKCEIDGKIYIGDIKTSSGIYDRTPFAQTSAYQMMEEEMTGIKDVQGRLIINLKKTGIFDEDKDVYISEHYEDDLELFMSALSIYRIMNNRFEPMNNYKSNKKTIRI
jgi:CRISPR/Cas system-associated exonuclease Cas4 (RecB family)